MECPDSSWPTAIDLCAGAGGVTTGFKKAKIQVLGALDIDDKARNTYQLNHPEVKFFRADLGKFSPYDFLDALSLQPGKLSILTACVPCQTFSSLGRQHRRKNDPRNELVVRIGHFTEVLRPSVIVMENVPPLRDDHRFTSLVDHIKRMGYGVAHSIVDAADFGVPQRRRRLILIGIVGRKDSDVPTLSTSHPALRKYAAQLTVREVFETILRHASKNDPLSQPRTNYPPHVAARIAAIPTDGGSRSSLPPDLQLACHRKGRKSAASNVYGRMQLDDVAPTLTTRCTTPSCGRFLHPTENRAITLREAASLQSFPLKYQFSGGSVSIQSQIGNAVPPRLAEAIGTMLRHELSL